MTKAIINPNDKFNRLTAIEFSHIGKNYQQHWLFKCDCGTVFITRVDGVKNGRTKSCGCLHIESLVGHPKYPKDTQGSPEYATWRHINARCKNPNNKSYKGYGGRGITVCSRWDDFLLFLADMGTRPDNHSIDRIDNNGNYTPDNCRWATNHQQARNKRNNVNITWDGRTQCLSDWANELGMSKATISQRLDKWGVERTMTQPLQRNSHALPPSIC